MPPLQTNIHRSCVKSPREKSFNDFAEVAFPAEIAVVGVIGGPLVVGPEQVRKGCLDFVRMRRVSLPAEPEVTGGPLDHARFHPVPGGPFA